LNWAPLQNTIVLITNLLQVYLTSRNCPEKSLHFDRKRANPQKVLRGSSARGVTPQLFSGCEADGDYQSNKTS
jgi:hypothetical protein